MDWMLGVRESEESGWGFPMRVIRKPWTEVRNARVGDGFLVESSALWDTVGVRSFQVETLRKPACILWAHGRDWNLGQVTPK